MKKIYILLAGVFSTLSIYGESFVTISEINTKNPQGIYFEKGSKQNTNLNGKSEAPTFLNANSNGSYIKINKEQNRKTNHILSRGNDINVNTNNYSGQDRTISSTSVSGLNLSLLNEKFNMPPISFDEPLANDNPGLDGPGGSSSGSVEGHVGAPIGNGFFILLIFVSMYLFVKRKKLLNSKKA